MPNDNPASVTANVDLEADVTNFDDPLTSGLAEVASPAAMAKAPALEESPPTPVARKRIFTLDGRNGRPCPVFLGKAKDAKEGDPPTMLVDEATVDRLKKSCAAAMVKGNAVVFGNFPLTPEKTDAPVAPGAVVDESLPVEVVLRLLHEGLPGGEVYV